MKNIRLTESDLHKIVKKTVKKVLRGSKLDGFDYDKKAYDANGHEIHKGDIVIWVDPQTRMRTLYEVYEKPSSEMVKLRNKYEKREVLLKECLVVG